nr:transposase [Bacillus sp. JAS24-2]
MIELFAKRKKGLHIQSVQKLLQGIMVYITNIPTEWVPKGEILDLYSLRWQIGVSR